MAYRAPSACVTFSIASARTGGSRPPAAMAAGRFNCAAIAKLAVGGGDGSRPHAAMEAGCFNCASIAKLAVGGDGSRPHAAMEAGCLNCAAIAKLAVGRDGSRPHAAMESGCFNCAAMAKLAVGGGDGSSGGFCAASPAPFSRRERRERLERRLGNPNARKLWLCESLEGPRDSVSDGGDEEAPRNPAEDKCDDPKRDFALWIKGRTRLLLRFRKVSPPKVTLRECVKYLRSRLREAVLLSIFACAVGIGCWCIKLAAMPSPQTVPYSQFIEYLHARTVTNALFEEGSRHIFFNVRSQNREDEQSPQVVSSDGPISGLTEKASMKHQPAAHWTYSTRKIENDESYVLALMRQNTVTYSSAPQSMSTVLRNALLTIVTLWIPLTPLIWIMQRQLSGGRTSGRRVMLNKQTTKFEDIAGVDDAKAELREIVSLLQDATGFKRIGAKFPKGVLLVGPPGTGKTLLARAVAGEAGVPFFSVCASEFVEMFVGRGAARIRELFAVSRKCAPSMIFIDELDAVGGHRGKSFNDERDQTLNQLLAELDGFDSEHRVLVIAATNRIEALDPALCRAGRFSRKVFMKEPDFEGRKQILVVHTRNISIEGDVEAILNTIASITYGFVGADLASVVNEAALLAVRQGRSAVMLEDLKAAVDRVKYGVGNKAPFNSILEKELDRWFGWIPLKTSTAYSGQSRFGYALPRLSG